MINWIVICIPFVAFWFACITGLPQKLKRMNRKPFTCSKCMGFWLATGYQIYLGFCLNSIVIIALSSLAAWFIERLSTKSKMHFNS